MAIEVAERARCFTRSLFAHFGGLDVLALATFDYMLSLVWVGSTDCQIGAPRCAHLMGGGS